MSSPVSSRTDPQQGHTRIISDLDYTTLKSLSDRLDLPGEGNWRRLISVLPGIAYDQATVERFGLNSNRVGGSPGYALLTDLSNRGISYDVLITGLKKLKFGAALNDLGYREEVKFIKQPEATPAIEGSKVTLTCEASGVPPPSYLWFKGREPLGDQVSNVLTINQVTIKDAAMYICRAANDVNTVFSNWAEIIVQTPPIVNHSNVLPGTPQITDMPVLHSVPEGEVTVPVESKLQLSIDASGPLGATLSYQWLKDTKPLEFGRTKDLVIARVGAKDAGTYNCRVMSDHGGSVLTPNCVVNVMIPYNPGPGPVSDHPSRGPLSTSSQEPQQFPHPAMEQLYPQQQNMRYFPQEYPVSSTVSFINPGYHKEGFPNVTHHTDNIGSHDIRNNITGQVPDSYPPLLPDADAGGQGEQPDLYDQCYDKVALLVGNKNYRMKDLQLNTPDRDAQDLAGVLQSAGFKVVSLIDLSKKEMEKAVEYFTTLIGKNVYALFFFAGHGFEYKSLNYMMPVDADVEKKPEQCVCAQEVLNAMQTRGAKLSIMILDMCRVNASVVQSNRGLDSFNLLNFAPVQGATGYFLLAFSCTRAERAYEASNDADALREKDKHNSIFVSALKEHLDNGTLNQRLDTLLTDAAAKVRDRGRMLNASAEGWMRPEIRHNMAGPLSLADQVKRGPDMKREDRAQVWKCAHIVPDSIVVGSRGSDRAGAKPSEIAVRLHFEAEHSNVLIVTAELLNGCLTHVEIHKMSMCLVQDGIPHHPKIKASDFDKEYRFSDRGGNYRVDHIPRPNDILHFRIPGIQKIRSQTVTLEIEVQYTFMRVGSSHRVDRNATLVTPLPPPLYSHVTVYGSSVTSPTEYQTARQH